MLKENTNLTKVKSYSINVSIPWSLVGVVYREVKILEVLEKFKWLLNEVDYDKSDEVLEVIKLIENAIEYGGRFREIKNEKNNLIISFSFTTIQDMLEFENVIIV